MPDRTHLRALCLGLIMVGTAGDTAAHAIDPPEHDRGHRLERPAEGSGQRGLVSVPSWAVWGAGAAVSLFAASALWRLTRSRERR